MRQKRYRLNSKDSLDSTTEMVLEDVAAAGLGSGTAVFRQLSGGQLAPVAARHTREEALSLIASLERFWPGPYVLRELQACKAAV